MADSFSSQAQETPKYVLMLIPDKNGYFDINGMPYLDEWQTRPPEDLEEGESILQAIFNYSRKRIHSPKKIKAEVFPGRLGRLKISVLEAI